MKNGPRRHPGWAYRARRLAGAWAALVVAFAVVATLVQGGTRYFYCEAMGSLAFDPCRAVAGDPGQPREVDDGVAVRAPHTDCCQLVTMAPLRDAARGDAPRAPHVARVAIVLPLPSIGIGGASAAASRAPGRLVRRATAPPSGSEARARSMVSLT